MEEEPPTTVTDKRKTLPATLAFEFRILQELRRMQLDIRELMRVQQELKETLDMAMGVPVSLEVQSWCFDHLVLTYTSY
jgi:hypothetical protein